MAKILESIVGQWLTAALEQGLDPNQFGCRKHRSTTHALVAMLHARQSTLDRGGAVRTLLVDFKKAFDSVNYNLLLQKLRDRNVPHCLIKWFFSYLQRRSQRVRVGTHHSGWLQLRGAMPEGSWLGPLAFLVVIDDLDVDCLLHKYVDDTALTELLQYSTQPTEMQSCFQQLLNWSANNDMAVNFSKTKELVMGPPSITSNLPLLHSDTGYIQRVTSVKLLGIHLDANFSWQTHVEAMVSKATQRLYFLKQLKRAGVAHAQLLHFYLAVIRPVLEYAAPLWNHLLTKTQSNKIEAIQRRAINIIFSYTHGMSYYGTLYIAGVDSLAARREHLAANFFKSVTHPSSCLHALLPPSRDSSVLSRLRSACTYPRLQSRTKKYISFLSFGLSHYQ